MPDTQLCTLTPDGRAVATRELKGCLFVYAHLLDMLKKPEIDRELAYNMFSVTEARIVDIAQALGVSVPSIAVRQARFAQVREANAQVHALKAALGRAASSEQVAYTLNTLSRAVRDWWATEGLGQVSSLEYERYAGVNITFSCDVSVETLLLGATTLGSEEEAYSQWLDSLRSRGFELVMREGDDNASLRDTDANRQRLTALILARLPTARITGTTNSYISNSVVTLRDIRVYVPSLADLDSLAAFAKGERGRP